MSDEYEPEHHLELVMPFVCVTSVGGPFDDDAFVAGYQLGRLDQELAVLDALEFASDSRLVDTRCLDQLDLIAMKHGWRVSHRGYESEGGWVDIDLERIPA